MTGRLRPGEAPLRAGENALWTIAPGRSGVHKFQLAYLYDLNTAGKYTVYAEIHDPSSKKWLRTNTVKFEVLPAAH